MKVTVCFIACLQGFGYLKSHVFVFLCGGNVQWQNYAVKFDLLT